MPSHVFIASLASYGSEAAFVWIPQLSLSRPRGGSRSCAGAGSRSLSRVHSLAAGHRPAPGRMATSKAKSMAKAAFEQKVVPIVVAQSYSIRLEDVSVGDMSGWRETDAKRVCDLKDLFLGGEYGLNILRKPAVLQAHGAPKNDTDGLRLLGDGKHTFAALRECKALYESDDAVNYDWSAPLIAAMTLGVDVQVIEFAEDDPDLVVAWAVGAHDDASNKFKATSLRDMVRVAEAYKGKVPGGDWVKTRALLEKVYGKPRRMMVYRMVMAAQTQRQDVLKKLADNDVPNSWISDNKFFMGQGADLGKRLSHEGRMEVIDVMVEDRAMGKGLSKEVFQNEYCLPMKGAESWIAAKRKEFGKFSDIPAFDRVASFLKSGRARVAILACTRGGIRFEGVSDEQPGINQCRVLIKELEAARELKKQEGNNTEETAPASEPDPTSSASGQAPTGTGSIPDDVDMNTVGADILVEKDPIKEAALEKVEGAMAKLNVYSDVDRLETALVQTLMPTHKLFIMVDAPTSRSRVALALLDRVAALLTKATAKKFRVAVPVGARLDLLVAVQNKLTVLFQGLPQYTVQLTHGPVQKERRRPSYLQVVYSEDHKTDTENVPVTVPALAVRARRGESTRLRCLCKDCPLRPKEELERILVAENGGQQTVPADIELEREDLEEALDDGQKEEEEDEAEGAEDGEVEMAAPGKKRDCIVDLWPFAYPADYYKSIVNALSDDGSSLPHHMAVLTCSGHPAPALAAHSMGIQLHLAQDRVKHHSRAHGEQILKSVLLRSFYADAKAKADPSTKRLMASEFHLLHVEAPKEQPICFMEVPGSSQTSSWRGCFNEYPTHEFLEKAVPKLLADEVQRFPVGFAKDLSAKPAPMLRVGATHGQPTRHTASPPAAHPRPTHPPQTHPPTTSTDAPTHNLPTQCRPTNPLTT